jgi:hypothetical protein
LTLLTGQRTVTVAGGWGGQEALRSYTDYQLHRGHDTAISPKDHFCKGGKEGGGVKRGGVGEHGYRKTGARVVESPMGNQTAIFLEFFTKASEISVKRSMKRDKSANS